MKKTSPKSVPKAYQMSIFGQADSLARMSQWQGKGEDYTENELACFLSLFDSSRERGDHKPRWLILENVKGIFSSGGGWDFAIVLCELAALGYGVEYALVNSKDYGVPQSRERVYIIGILQEEVPEKYFLSKAQAKQLLHRLLEARREAESMTQEAFHQLSLQEQED